MLIALSYTLQSGRRLMLSLSLFLLLVWDGIWVWVVIVDVAGRCKSVGMSVVVRMARCKSESENHHPNRRPPTSSIVERAPGDSAK